MRPADIERTWCDFCGSSFIRKAMYLEHMELNHPSAIPHETRPAPKKKTGKQKLISELNRKGK